jgi:hypothetical protein
MIGSFPGSWGYSLQNGCLHHLIVNKHPFQFLPYGPYFTTGDVITIRVDLSDVGIVEYFKNGVSLGVAFTGFKKYGNIYLGISLL